jgi:hypothetical protein
MATIFWYFLKQFLKRKFHTFPSIFYMMAQHPPLAGLFFTVYLTTVPTKYPHIGFAIKQLLKYTFGLSTSHHIVDHDPYFFL